MKKYLILSLVILLGSNGCATAPAKNTNNALKTSNISFNFDLDKPLHVRPVLEAKKGKHYVPVIPLKGEVNEESVADVIDLLDQAEKANVEGVIIQLDSPGGDVSEGLKLIEKIEAFPAPTYCIANTAISMGYAILQSCTQRAMIKRGILMAHSIAAGGLMHGNPEDWESVAAMMKAMNLALAEHCAARMNISVDYYLSKTRGNLQWWMGSSTALEFGAVDKVYKTWKQVLIELRN